VQGRARAPVLCMPWQQVMCGVAAGDVHGVACSVASEKRCAVVLARVLGFRLLEGRVEGWASVSMSFAATAQQSFGQSDGVAHCVVRSEVVLPAAQRRTSWCC
jgi:hypothetical protein